MRPPPPHVFRLSASDQDALFALLFEVDAGALERARAIGSGPSVLSFAALSSGDVEHAIQIAKKVGLDPAAEELRVKQGIFVRLRPSDAPERIAFLFSGQGSQYGGMMRRLSEELEEPRRIIERIDRWHEDQGIAPISPVMFAGREIPRDIYLVQASVLAADLMAHAALKSAGIEPFVVTGHSFGDYAALVAAGAWTLETALSATRIRSEAIVALGAPGGMMSVSTSRSRLLPLLVEAKAGGHVQAANINAPDQIVVSGEAAALDALDRILGREKIERARLDVPGAFHSTLMAGVKSHLTVRFSELEIMRPKTPFLSSVTRGFEIDPKAIRRSLVDQLTEPVDFVKQIERLLGSGVNVFIECGPRGVLASLTKRIAKGADLADVADVAIGTADDAKRPGRFALARVSSMLDARRASSYSRERGTAMASLNQEGSRAAFGPADGEPVLTLLDGEAAAQLLSDEGFEEFWARTRPSVLALIEGLWAAERGSTVPEAPPPLAESEPPSSGETAHPAPSAEEVKSFLLESFSAETGYPPDLIEVGADLEADLGIDTVKQAQVLGRVRDHFDIRTEDKLSLRDFPTVGHIMKYVEKELLKKRGPSGAPARRSRVPMVDLTERRSKPPPGKK